MRLSDSSKNTAIPYRESKLTRILRNSLEGHSKVVIICNITASSFVFEETLSTLKFAMRAKNVKQNARKNEIIDDKFLLNRYQNEIKALQARLKEMENLLNRKEPEKKGEEGEKKVGKKQLDMVSCGKLEIEPKIEETIQKKIEIENELQRLVAKIVVSENVSFSRVDVGIGGMESQERRRNRVSMIRDSIVVKGRVRSEVFDYRNTERIRSLARQDSDIPQAHGSIKTREDLIVSKIEENLKRGTRPEELAYFSVLFSADEICEEGGEKVQSKIEEHENYIKTLVNQITRKDQEIEKLKDELDLCKGNFNRLQKLLSLK